MRISWTLAKHMNPFGDVDIIKECILEARNVLFENKEEIIDTLRRIPLSSSSNTRNTNILAEENYAQVKQLLAATDCYDLAMDESCGNMDAAQFIIFVRYLDKTSEQFVEESSIILQLSEATRIEEMYRAVMEYFLKRWVG